MRFFLYLFIFLLLSQNFYSQDNDENCEKFLQNDKIELQKFKENEIKYKAQFLELRNEIFNKNNLGKIKTNNIVIYIISNTFTNDHITNCESRSTLFYDKILFLDQLFWNVENLIYISKKSKKNIIPALNYGTKFFTDELLDYMKDDLKSYNYLKKLPSFGKEKYIPIKNKSIHNLGTNYTKILVNFSQFESNKEVNIQVTDLKNKNQRILVYKMDRKWVKISESTNKI